ncbi:thiamine pyrophosphate-dependent enzyme [Nocardia yamanashiensis]|uniref:thiamine pyrophosphate-binding protein n=1 Tax=Nocardia yamanashiensis TaxID=209247 RepID=UPI001E467B05|nr:thiamine pyrophosphate-binding protein [Nocardia yamanashiensis]UGT38828.1 thiamine pyrophosphate-dependent enzyme [Nocardia yamanashiensis]
MAEGVEVETVREVAYDVLRSFGATTIVANPGSNELPFLDRLPADFQFALGLQEGSVISIADGYAQASGKPVVVSVHSAAGLATGMGALTNAYENGAPLIIIAGLWTAAQHQCDITFIVLRNGTYQVLEDCAAMLDAQLPDIKLRDIDFLGLASGYGVAAERVSDADAAAIALRKAFDEPGPHLIEVNVMAQASGMF